MNNLKLTTWRNFLKSEGLEKIRTRGGHEIWSKKNITRPIIFSIHTKDIPNFEIRSNLKTLKIDYNTFKDKIQRLKK